MTEPGAGRHRRPRVRSLRKPALVALVAAVVALATVLWHTSAGLTAPDITGTALARDEPPRHHVGVERIDTPLLWTGPSAPAVTVVVRNTGSAPQQALVWWVLSRPDVAAPWQHPAVESRHAAVDLLAHQSGRVVLAAPGESLPHDGRYRLSAWVHVRRPDGTEVHSDGVALAADITVVHTDPALSVRASGPTPLRILAVDVAPDPTRPGQARVAVTVANSGRRLVAGRLTVRGAGRAGGAVRAAPVVAVLDAAAPITLSVRLPVSDPATVTATLAEVAADGSALATVTAVRHG